MRTLLIAFAAAGLVGLPAGAVAQFDDTPNQLGIFFDLDLSAPVTNTDDLMTYVTMYAVLINGPVEGIRGFELGLDLRDGCTAYMFNMAFDPAVEVIGHPQSLTNLLVAYRADQPYNPALGGMLLVHWTMYFLTGGSIYLGPASPSSVQG